MKWYEVYTLEGGVFQIECDPIDFEEIYYAEDGKPLPLFREGRLVAVLKIWDNVIDITENKGVKDV
jgi:hypothetical protein